MGFELRCLQKEGKISFYYMCTLWQTLSLILFPLDLWQGKSYFPHCLDKKLGLGRKNESSRNTQPVMGGSGIKT